MKVKGELLRMWTGKYGEGENWVREGECDQSIKVQCVQLWKCSKEIHQQLTYANLKRKKNLKPH